MRRIVSAAGQITINKNVMIQAAVKNQRRSGTGTQEKRRVRENRTVRKSIVALWSKKH